MLEALIFAFGGAEILMYFQGVDETPDRSNLVPQITRLLVELSRCDTIEQIARVCCERARQAVSSDGVCFVLIEDGHAHYIEEDSVNIFLKGTSRGLEDCICGWCIQHEQLALVDDVYQDERIHIRFYDDSYVRSLAMIPINGESGVIGALGFYFSQPSFTSNRIGYDQERTRFQDHRIPMMECLAEAAGFALKNATILANVDTVIAERTDALERVNHELETFAYTVAHDLKNPLSVVKTNCWTILNLMAEQCSDKTLECVQRMETAVERMKGQIDGMLEMYRLTNAEFDLQNIDLSTLALATVELLRAREPDRTVDCTIEPGMHAYGDSRTLGALIENLLSNAWKFTSDIEKPQIEFFSIQTDDDGLVYVVRDNGAGFSVEEAQTLFKVFHRLPDTADIEGHGIGLTSVRRIINKHGGRVWAEGVKGQGASFFFTLPLLPIDTDLEEFIEEHVEI